MSVDQRLLAVIQVLYDAALDETLWPKALQELVGLTSSQGASFWTLDSSEQPRLPIFTTFNFDDRFIRAYLENMVPLDPTVQYLVRHPDTPIVHDGIVITERDKDFNPYYDWQSGQCDIHFRMVGQTRPAPAVQAGVALHRTRKAGRYEPEDLDRFALIHGHLQRALAIGMRLGSLGAAHACTTELLDRNPAAILLLDDHKSIVYANRRAEEFRSATDGLRLLREGIVLARKQDNDKLQKLIAGVLSVAALPGVAGGVMRSQRPSGKRPYGIVVAPVASRYPALTAFRPVVCIIITDPEARTSLRNDSLIGAFGLTEAEARLAAMLATGEELRSAAARLGITYGTARTRLAEIFQKTQTRRQTELVRVLLTTLATL
jgi:DNA-binding CsgD family transcriptional regulator/PAS domain-containing protein